MSNLFLENMVAARHNAQVLNMFFWQFVMSEISTKKILWCVFVVNRPIVMFNEKYIRVLLWRKQ